MSQNPQETPNQSQSQSEQSQAQRGTAPASPSEPVSSPATAENINSAEAASGSADTSPSGTAPSSADTAGTTSAGSADPYGPRPARRRLRRHLNLRRLSMRNHPSRATAIRPPVAASHPPTVRSQGYQQPLHRSQCRLPATGLSAAGLRRIPTSKLATQQGYQTVRPRTSRRTASRATASRDMHRSNTDSPDIRSSGMPQPGVAPVSRATRRPGRSSPTSASRSSASSARCIAYLVYKDRSEWLKQTHHRGAELLDLVQHRVRGQRDLDGRFVIGLILWPLVFIVALIFCILGTIAASKHEFYKYPVNVRFIK